MIANERREEIIRILRARKFEKMSNLAFEFGVDIRTIRRDITHLTISYPLVTKAGRYDSGVYWEQWWQDPHANILSQHHKNALKIAVKAVDKETAKCLKEILEIYGTPKGAAM